MRSRLFDLASPNNSSLRNSSLRNSSPRNSSLHLLNPRCRKARLAILFGLACFWSVILGARLLSLQVFNFELWQDWALRQHFAQVEVASERGPIYDRNGKLLAVSVPAGSIYVRPRQITNRKEVGERLSGLLGLSRDEIEKKLNTPSPFVWIKRQMPRAFAEKVDDWGLSGVGYVLEAKRYYPFNQAGSSLVGKVGIDGVGLSGVEALYEKQLHEEHVKTRVVRDALGKTMQFASDGGQAFELPRGEALRLTIDADLQLIVDEELEKGRQASNAKQAYAVMIDSETGEVLAMSQAPSMNFNNPSTGAKDELTNRIVEAVFEPGSIFKPLVAAAAIDKGIARPEEMINCERGRFAVGRHTIKDVHPQGILSFRDVVVRSSNIGMTKIGMRMGSERLYEAIRTFGFGEGSDLGFPGESKGILRPESTWAFVDVATHAFGQGVAVTPLQIVRAVASIANGGKLPRLQLLQSEQPFASKRVISEKTAGIVRDIMYGVVEDAHGTGKKGAIKGIRVGGKTGTAQKARQGGGGYAAGSYVASFVGFVDLAPLGIKQNITLIVSIDEPKAAVIYGGTLAGPVFHDIMLRSLQLISTRYELRPPSEEPLYEPQKKGFTTVSYKVSR